MADVEVVEPDEEWSLDDEEQEAVQFLTTGGLRCQIKGVWYRLRRPDMGELRKLHEAFEAISDELTPFSQEQERKARDLAEQVKELKGKADALKQSATPESDLQALFAEVNELVRQQRKTTFEVHTKALEMRERWWREVFKALKTKSNPTPKVPAQMPTWVADQDMAVKAIEHWMRVPLGRGK